MAKNIFGALHVLLIVCGAIVLFSAREYRPFWLVAAVAIGLTLIVLWSALLLTGQHKQARTKK